MTEEILSPVTQLLLEGFIEPQMPNDMIEQMIIRFDVSSSEDSFGAAASCDLLEVFFPVDFFFGSIASMPVTPAAKAAVRSKYFSNFIIVSSI